MASSWLRGARYIHPAHSLAEDVGTGLLESGELAAVEAGVGVVPDTEIAGLIGDGTGAGAGTGVLVAEREG